MKELEFNLLDEPIERAHVTAVSDYVDKWLAHKELRRLTAYGLVTTINGITKCSATWQAISQYCQWDPTDTDVRLVSIGEGARPSVSAMCSLLTDWRCLMIDPQLSNKWYELSDKIPGLTCNTGLPLAFKSSKLILLSINAHVDLNWYYHQFYAPKMLVIAMPCHVQQVIEDHTPIFYIDYGIACGRNEMLVWAN